MVAHEAARQHVGAKQEDDVEDKSTTDSTIDALVLHMAVVDGGERQPSQRAGHAQHGGSEDPTDQSTEEMPVKRQRQPLSAPTNAPVVRNEGFQVVRGCRQLKGGLRASSAAEQPCASTKHEVRWHTAQHVTLNFKR